MINPNYPANIFGVFALIALAIAIIPALIGLFKAPHHSQRLSLQIGRYSLLGAVSLGLAHGLLMTQRENLDFYNLNLYWVYAGGLFAFNLLVFLAFMYPELRADSKKLSYFSCAALLLLCVHIGQQIIF